jgi:hypothetical protein
LLKKISSETPYVLLTLDKGSLESNHFAGIHLCLLNPKDVRMESSENFAASLFLK